MNIPIPQDLAKTRRYLQMALYSENPEYIYIATHALYYRAEKLLREARDAYGLALTNKVARCLHGQVESPAADILPTLFFQISERLEIRRIAGSILAADLAEDCRRFYEVYRKVDPSHWPQFSFPQALRLYAVASQAA